MNHSNLPSLPDMENIWQQTINWTPSIQQQEQFQRLYELILEGNRQLNLTSITDPQEFWEKHLWDSLRGIAFLLPPSLTPSLPDSLTPSSFIDIGTGAGFPGIPIAIVFGDCTMTLLDATRKKITFIDKIQETLNLTNIKTLIGRVEEIGHQLQHRQTYDIALVRAVGSASVCAEYSLPLLKQDGLAVIYRGNWTDDEKNTLENAVEQLGGVIESIEGFTTPLSHAVRHCIYVRKVTNTPSQFPRAVGIPTQKPL